jgi:hypothetical protein
MRSKLWPQATRRSESVTWTFSLIARSQGLALLASYGGDISFAKLNLHRSARVSPSFNGALAKAANLLHTPRMRFGAGDVAERLKALVC